MLEVRKERTGWRDLSLNERHREWGYDCPAVDVDQMFIEYDRAIPKALVEYKNEHAAPQRMNGTSYKALVALGNMAGLPVFFVRYADDFSWFRVYPMNALATDYVNFDYLDMSECEYVDLLYRIRGTPCPLAIRSELHTTRTPATITLDHIDWNTRQVRAAAWADRKAAYPYRRFDA